MDKSLLMNSKEQKEFLIKNGEKNPIFSYNQTDFVGIEILPTKKMQKNMSSGIAYFEGEVYNVMRQGRNNPPVPLLILGIEP